MDAQKGYPNNISLTELDYREDIWQYYIALYVTLSALDY